ncbi:MAG: hypothetical protein AMJ59_26665 [Gammaproteobacteria bacterium SG8_31]|nr:MAG: hypothetical protein AMJ59_26665 [Gammaproteobacteria bacterium SG8_31]
MRDLPFDEFVDASYQQILLRSPEMVTSMGLSQSLGIRDDQLDDICYTYVDDTYELKAGIQEILESYDPSELNYDQRISYDSYSWLLADWNAEREFMYHVYPVTHGFSRQNDLFRFFEDEQPLETLENVQDYISRLEQVDEQFACLIGNLEDSEARGIMAPAQMLQRAADRIRGVVPGSAASLPFYTALEEKIGAIAELSAGQRQDFLAQAIQAINSSVIPAYQALVAALDGQIPRAPAMNGVWQLPNGDGFYAAMLRHHTTTERSAAEIHQQGLDEVARITEEIRDAFDLLGYPPDETFPQLYNRVAVDSGVVRAAEIVPLFEDFILQAQEDVTEVFDIAPQAEVIVIGTAGGGFFVAGSLDGSRPGAFYIGNQTDGYRYWMRTIAYHETVPGHHFQIAIGNEQDVPLFSKGGSMYTAFVEGWALYAEYLAKELGWYDDDIYSELGRMQWELLRAVRMVVDTGLHHFRWSRQQAIDYYVDTVGETPEQAAQQIDLYLYWPGYFTAYKMGMMKILELRQHAMDELGELFDIKEFHRAVLLHNRLPLALLERVIEDYIVAARLEAQSRNINQGHAGAWFNPENVGQGQLIDIEPEGKFLFLSWFTFTDTASANPNEQHWFTAQGNYSDNTADLVIHETLGGRFNDPQQVSTEPVGEATLSFTDCGHGQMDYTIDTWGLQGSFPLRRVIPGAENVCLERAGVTNEPLDPNDGRDGAWFDEGAPGQGFLIDAHPNAEGDDFIFMAWFTYGDEMVSGQRWLTAQGPLAGTIGDLVLHETTGGSFDDPKPSETVPVGSLTIDFTDCSHALLTYSLTDQALEGSIDIKRAVPGSDALCRELNEQDD